MGRETANGGCLSCQDLLFLWQDLHYSFGKLNRHLRLKSSLLCLFSGFWLVIDWQSLRVLTYLSNYSVWLDRIRPFLYLHQSSSIIVVPVRLHVSVYPFFSAGAWSGDSHQREQLAACNPQVRATGWRVSLEVVILLAGGCRRFCLPLAFVFPNDIFLPSRNQLHTIFREPCDSFIILLHIESIFGWLLHAHWRQRYRVALADNDSCRKADSASSKGYHTRLSTKECKC